MAESPEIQIRIGEMIHSILSRVSCSTKVLHEVVDGIWFLVPFASEGFTDIDFSHPPTPKASVSKRMTGQTEQSASWPGGGLRSLVTHCLEHSHAALEGCSFPACLIH